MAVGSVPVPRVPFEWYGPTKILNISLTPYIRLIIGQMIIF